jgi:hypothetical protein
MQIEVAPNFERKGVIAGFVLGVGSGLAPSITKGALFAQGILYRPAEAPALPAAPAGQMSWLYYNSITGFYWQPGLGPVMADDAFLGWVLADASQVRLVSNQVMVVPDPDGTATEITPLGAVLEAGPEGGATKYETCPLDFGAVGDGVADDTAAVAAAIAAADGIYLPANYTFLVTGITVTDRPGMRFFGGGALKLKTASNHEVLRLEGCPSSSIENVELDGNKAGQSIAYADLALQNCAWSTVKDCRVHDAKGGGVIVVNYDTSEEADEVRISGCQIRENGSHGIELLGTSSTLGPGDLIISGNYVEMNGGHGIWVHGTASAQCGNVTIADNQVLSNATHGVLAEYCVGLRIEGGNQIRNNNGNGIVARHCTHGGMLGAQVHLNSRGGAGSYSGIDVDTCSDFTVSNCYTGDTGGTVMQGYGLQIYGPSYTIILTGNNFGPGENLYGAVSIGSGSTYWSYGNKGLADSLQALALPTGVVGAVVSGSEWLDPVRLVTHRKIQGTITLPAAPQSGEWVTVWLRTPRNASTLPLWLGQYPITGTPQTIVLEPPQPLDVPDVDEEWEIAVTTSVGSFQNSPANAVWSDPFEVPGLALPANNTVTDADTGKKVGGTWYSGQYRYGYNKDGLELWGRDVKATMPAATAELYQEFMFWTVEWHNSAGNADPNGKEQHGNEFAKPGELWEDISGLDWPMPVAPYDYCWTRLYMQGRKPGSSPVLLHCWAGGADHKIDHPVTQGAGLDAGRLAPATVGNGVHVSGGQLQVQMDTTRGLSFDGSGNLLVNVNSTDFQFSGGAIRYNTVDFARAGNFDTNAFKITGSTFQVNHLSATTITLGNYSIGGGTGMPGQMAVYNSIAVMVGWIGAQGGYYGGWFKQLYVGGSDPSTAKLVADGAGNLSISGAAITVVYGATTVTINASTGFQSSNVSGSDTYKSDLNSGYLTVSHIASGVTQKTGTYSYGQFGIQQFGSTPYYAVSGNITATYADFRVHDGVGAAKAEIYIASSGSFANFPTLQIGGTEVIDNGRWANFVGLKVGSTTVINAGRDIGSKTAAQILLRNSNSSMSNGELVAYYDGGTGKATLEWFDGGNHFKWQHDA